jgi:hypothetical protein
LFEKLAPMHTRSSGKLATFCTAEGIIPAGDVKDSRAVWNVEFNTGEKL